MMVDIDLVVQQIDKKITMLEEIQHFKGFKFSRPRVFSIDEHTDFEFLENETKENGDNKGLFKVKKWLNQSHNMPSSSNETVEERIKRPRFKSQRYKEFMLKTMNKSESESSSSSSSSSDKLVLKKVEPNKEFFCSICNKFLSASYSLTRHMQIHSGHRPHICRICQHKFIQRSDLDRHLLTHERPKITCNTCGKTFKSKKILHIHNLQIHPNSKEEPPLFECTAFQCSNLFQSRRTLRSHIRNFHGISYKCDFCGKKLRTKSRLSSHLSMHTNGTA